MNDGVSESLTLPPGFDLETAHLFRIDVDYRRISVRVDEVHVSTNVYLDSQVSELRIFSDDHSVTIASLEMTAGFEELFEADLTLEENGWVLDGVDSHRIEGGELTLDSKARGSLTKGGPNARLEFAANLRTVQDDGSGGNFGIEVRTVSGGSFLLDVDVDRRAVVVNGVGSPLPPDVRLTQFHQLRIVKRSGSALAYFDDVDLGEFPVDSGPAVCAVYSDRTKIAIEMIRLTAI